MKEVTVKNYQELAMRTCLPSAKNWEYCYCLIASEIGEALPRKLSKDNCNNFDATKILKKVGLTKEKVKEALKMKIREQIKPRGVISPVKTPCKCGGRGMLQEWIESDFRGDSKRYAVVFCLFILKGRKGNQGKRL